MAVRVRDVNRIPDITRVLRELNRKRIEIGIFGSDDSFLAMIATVHEFGLTIKAKHRFLAIPTKLAKGKSPREIPDLVFIPTHGGARGLLVRSRKGRGQAGDRTEIFFYLVPSVKIPERSFIRSTFDEEVGSWTEFVAKRFTLVLQDRMSVDAFFVQIGQQIVRDIQDKILKIDNPPNAPITIANKGSSSPLIDSGRMRQAVTYRVVSD